MYNLQKESVIITGAASGIGSAVTKRCIKEGMTVIACDCNNNALKEQSRLYNKESYYPLCFDVSSHEEVNKNFKDIFEKFPECTSLVNNAGIYLAKNILEYLPEEIDLVLKVNIKGAIYCTKEFMKHNKKRNSSIVNISSVSGQEGSSDAIYGLSKAGLIGLTKSCAMNFAPKTRVNAVAPGLVNTSMMKSVPEWRQKEYREKDLIDSPIEADDVASSVVFLLSDQSKHITGSVIDLNNGAYLR